MKKISYVVILPAVLVLSLTAPLAAQNCSSPPSGYGSSWWRAYAAWCSSCCGTPDASTTSCNRGPNWGCKGSSDGSASSSSSSPPAYDYEAERQRREAERKRREEELRRQEEERQRREAEEAKRRQEEFERNKQQALRDMKGIAGELGLKGLDTSDSFGLKGVGDTATEPNDTSKPALPSWDAQISNPQIGKLAKGLNAIQVPPPLPPSEASFSWKKIYFDNPSMLHNADYLVDFWELTGTLGGTASLHCRVILIAGRTFIAGEEGAYVHLIKQEQAYEDALRYLKDPATSRRFARLVHAIKSGRPVPGPADPAMLKAARAILDPKLGGSGMRIAWDSMLSPEARAAMVRKAALEIGTGLVSAGTEGLLYDLTKRRELYNAARFQREEARKMLKHTTDPLDKAQLRKVIDHANHVLDALYRLQHVVPTAASNAIGDATEELAAIYVGEEKKGASAAAARQQR